MDDYLVTFDGSEKAVRVPAGTLLVDAARLAGYDVLQPCGGQGRCGRCTVRVVEGSVRQRSTVRLSAEDVKKGYALACQAVVESNLRVVIPTQEKIERHLAMDRIAGEVGVPAGYDAAVAQTVHRIPLTLSTPSMDDQTDDLSRLRAALRLSEGLNGVEFPLSVLRKMGGVLRAANWQITVLVNVSPGEMGQVIDLIPNASQGEPLWGAAIDIGTTTVTAWIVDLMHGKVRAQASAYNGQIARGEDVISRVIYSSKSEANAQEMQDLVIETIHQVLGTACRSVPGLDPGQIVKATITGNSVMTHLLLRVPAETIRQSPFINGLNEPPLLRARELGLGIHPEGIVDCLPGVASYVGSDITAGVLSSGMEKSNKLTLFMDVGTNGEIVLGSDGWLVACACSAGPAFEGAGVVDGMRATRGAIEEVWIRADTREPVIRVIGGGKPSGICGSGLISLLAEAFITGVVDKAGHMNPDLNTPRIRQGEHGWEYVVAWGEDSAHGRDIVLTHVDVNNLLRAKAAIYAGYTVLAEQVGLPFEDIEQMLVGGSFGKYINIEKAIQIGLLPDMPWDRFQFLGNTSIRGAYRALIDHEARRKIQEIAGKMTYIELSADNSFYEAFMSAMFLPHTDGERFPSVKAGLATTPA